MNTSGEAADQIVRMTLNGVEMAAKITGAGAKELAALLYAVMKDQKKTKGKMRLANMLRSGKELKVFAVKDAELARFCKEAKKYGVLYCVLKDRDAKVKYNFYIGDGVNKPEIDKLKQAFKSEDITENLAKAKASEVRASVFSKGKAGNE